MSHWVRQMRKTHAFTQSLARASYVVFEERDHAAESHVLGEIQSRPPLLKISDHMQRAQTNGGQRVSKTDILAEVSRDILMQRTISKPQQRTISKPQQRTISSRVVSALAVTRHFRWPREQARCTGADSFLTVCVRVCVCVHED